MLAHGWTLNANAWDGQMLFRVAFSPRRRNLVPLK